MNDDLEYEDYLNKISEECQKHPNEPIRIELPRVDKQALKSDTVKVKFTMSQYGHGGL